MRTAAVIWVQAKMVKFEKNKWSCEFPTTWNWNAEMPASDILQAESPIQARNWTYWCIYSAIMFYPLTQVSSPTSLKVQDLQEAPGFKTVANVHTSQGILHFTWKSLVGRNWLSHRSAEILTLSQKIYRLPLPSASSTHLQVRFSKIST